MFCCEESKCVCVSCTQNWHDWSLSRFFSVCWMHEGKGLLELHYEQVFMRLCNHVNWRVFLYHILSSCCCRSWNYPLSSSSISLLFSERLFIELLPLGQLYLLLEFVSYLLFHCSAKPFIVLLCVKITPRKQSIYSYWQTFLRDEGLNERICIAKLSPRLLLLLGGGRDSVICSTVAICSSVNLSSKHLNPSSMLLL